MTMSGTASVTISLFATYLALGMATQQDIWFIAAFIVLPIGMSIFLINFYIYYKYVRELKKEIEELKKIPAVASLMLLTY
jgi:hypothetical protein